MANGTYPSMSLLISNNGGNTFFNAPSPTFDRQPGRLTTVARYQNTVIVGGQIFPNGQQVRDLFIAVQCEINLLSNFAVTGRVL